LRSGITSDEGLDGLAGAPLPGLGFLGLGHVEGVLPAMRAGEELERFAGRRVVIEESGQLHRDLDHTVGFVR
jgi:hypothetical protein